MVLVIYLLSLAADGVGPLSRGPHELRERVGRAEAQVASMLLTTFNAILLPNAKFELLIELSPLALAEVVASALCLYCFLSHICLAGSYTRSRDAFSLISAMLLPCRGRRWSAECC